MNRTLLGILAAALLLVGVVTWVSGPPDGSAIGFAGGCIRVGLVLGALWLALPQILTLFKRTPGWLFGRFLGRGKTTGEEQKPVTPVKRPRRRSTG